MLRYLLELIGLVNDIVEAVNSKGTIRAELGNVAAAVNASLLQGAGQTGNMNPGQITLLSYVEGETNDFWIDSAPFPEASAYMAVAEGSHEGVDEALHDTCMNVYDECIKAQSQAAKQMAAGLLMGIAADVVAGRIIDNFTGPRQYGDVDASLSDVYDELGLGTGFSRMRNSIPNAPDSLNAVFGAIDREKAEYINLYGNLRRYYEILEARQNAEFEWYQNNPGQYGNWGPDRVKNPYSGSNTWSVRGFEYLVPEAGRHSYNPSPSMDYVSFWNTYGYGKLL